MKKNNKITPRLPEIRKDNPYTVPPGYFEEMPGRIRSLVTEGGDQIPKLSPAERVWQVIKPQIALVAAIAGFAFLGYHGFRFVTETRHPDVSGDQISEFIKFNYYSFEHSSILSLMDEEEFYEDFYYYDEEMDAYIEYLKQESDLDLYAILEEF